MNAVGRYLFLDPGADVTRRDVYDKGRARGMEVLLLSRVLGWERDHVDHWVEGDPTDPASAVEVARAWRIDGVVSCSESCLQSAAEAAAACGVGGLSPQLARICRDKVLMAERLRPAGIPMASRRVVVDEREAIAAAREIGCPGVLKPSTGVASLFTVKYGSIDELSRWFREFESAARDRAPESLRAMCGRWLVEEFLEGPAFSVESVTSAGHTTHIAICEKGRVRPPFFREVGHCSPPALAEDAQWQLLDLTERAIAALGIDDCPTHTEFKWTPAGPRLLEVGARMGGGSIRQVVQLATGVDLLEVTLDLATGSRIDARPRARGGAASRSLYPHQPGRLISVDLARLASLPGIVAVNDWMKPGEEYRTPPDGYREVVGLVATAHDSAGAVAYAEAAVEMAQRAGLVRLAPHEESSS